MTAPLRMSFDVACSAGHAFTVWTADIGTWWPPDHTVSGRAEEVVLQSGVGGRIYERTADGTEHEWGEVTAWDPPARLAYAWHIRRDRADATDVTISFTALTPSRTRVDIHHSGWERLGAAAEERERDATDRRTISNELALDRGFRSESGEMLVEDRKELVEATEMEQGDEDRPRGVHDLMRAAVAGQTPAAPTELQPAFEVSVDVDEMHGELPDGIRLVKA